jgi:hypothetical protein
MKHQGSAKGYEQATYFKMSPTGNNSRHGCHKAFLFMSLKVNFVYFSLFDGC